MNHPIRLAAVPVIAVSAAATAGQYHMQFGHYTGYQSRDVDPLAGVSVTIDTDASLGNVDLTFALDPLAGVGTIKSIWFEDGAGLGDAVAIWSEGQVDVRADSGSRNPAGARGELGWEGTESRFGRSGRASNGIDAGESLTIRFAGSQEFFGGGLEALLAGEARIAFHLQRLGTHRCESAHFTSMGGSTTLETIPLPSAGLMAAAGLSVAGVSRRRRRPHS